MELLSEVRTAAQVLNFALSRERERERERERGQENQKETLRSSAPNWNSQVNTIMNLDTEIPLTRLFYLQT